MQYNQMFYERMKIKDKDCLEEKGMHRKKYCN